MNFQCGVDTSYADLLLAASFLRSDFSVPCCVFYVWTNRRLWQGTNVCDREAGLSLEISCGLKVDSSILFTDCQSLVLDVSCCSRPAYDINNNRDSGILSRNFDLACILGVSSRDFFAIMRWAFHFPES